MGNEVNVVLLTILSLMIGFTIGNAFGKESMKRIFSTMIQQMLDGVKAATNKKGEE